MDHVGENSGIRFEPDRLFADPRYAAYAAAAVAAVAEGDAGPISEKLRREGERDSPNGKRGDAPAHELAAFAISTQGLTALTARCRGVDALPGPLAEFIFEEVPRAGARACRLRDTLVETVAALRAAGIEVVALKGAALAFFHYADPALRPMGDLDLLLVEPRDLNRATDAMGQAGWRALLDTQRHRVFARPDERVVRPASEDPQNPIRIEVHTSFRLPVLGHVYDASPLLRETPETRDLTGTRVAIAGGPALATHLLFHAAEDFAGNGIRGIQAHDFRVLAGKGKSAAFAPASVLDSVTPGPLLYAADAIERLFPLTFEELFLSSLPSRVDPVLRARAAALPALRYTRPPHGWTRTLLTLADSPGARARLLLRTAFPSPGEVKANVAPDASGAALALAYAHVLVGRLRGAIAGLFR